MNILLAAPHCHAYFSTFEVGVPDLDRDVFNLLALRLRNLKFSLALPQIYILYDDFNIINISSLYNNYSFMVSLFRQTDYDYMHFLLSTVKSVIEPVFKATQDNIVSNFGFDKVWQLPLSVKTTEVVYFKDVDYTVLANRNLKPAVFMLDRKVLQTTTEVNPQAYKEIYFSPFQAKRSVPDDTEPIFKPEFDTSIFNEAQIAYYPEKPFRYLLISAKEQGSVQIEYVVSGSSTTESGSYEVAPGLNLIDIGRTIVINWDRLGGQGGKFPAFINETDNIVESAWYEFSDFNSTGLTSTTPKHDQPIARFCTGGLLVESDSTREFRMGLGVRNIPIISPFRPALSSNAAFLEEKDYYAHTLAVVKSAPRLTYFSLAALLPGSMGCFNSMTPNVNRDYEYYLTIKDNIKTLLPDLTSQVYSWFGACAFVNDAGFIQYGNLSVDSFEFMPETWRIGGWNESQGLLSTRVDPFNSDGCFRTTATPPTLVTTAQFISDLNGTIADTRGMLVQLQKSEAGGFHPIAAAITRPYQTSSFSFGGQTIGPTGNRLTVLPGTFFYTDINGNSFSTGNHGGTEATINSTVRLRQVPWLVSTWSTNSDTEFNWRLLPVNNTNYFDWTNDSRMRRIQECIRTQDFYYPARQANLLFQQKASNFAALGIYPIYNTWLDKYFTPNASYYDYSALPVDQRPQSNCVTYTPFNTDYQVLRTVSNTTTTLPPSQTSARLRYPGFGATQPVSGIPESMFPEFYEMQIALASNEVNRSRNIYSTIYSRYVILEFNDFGFSSLSPLINGAPIVGAPEFNLDNLPQLNQIWGNWFGECLLEVTIRISVTVANVTPPVPSYTAYECHQVKTGIFLNRPGVQRILFGDGDWVIPGTTTSMYGNGSVHHYPGAIHFESITIRLNLPLASKTFNYTRCQLTGTPLRYLPLGMSPTSTDYILRFNDNVGGTGRGDVPFYYLIPTLTATNVSTYGYACTCGHFRTVESVSDIDYSRLLRRRIMTLKFYSGAFECQVYPRTIPSATNGYSAFNGMFPSSFTSEYWTHTFNQKTYSMIGPDFINVRTNYSLMFFTGSAFHMARPLNLPLQVLEDFDRNYTTNFVVTFGNNTAPQGITHTFYPPMELLSRIHVLLVSFNNVPNSGSLILPINAVLNDPTTWPYVNEVFTLIVPREVNNGDAIGNRKACSILFAIDVTGAPSTNPSLNVLYDITANNLVNHARDLIRRCSISILPTNMNRFRQIMALETPHPLLNTVYVERYGSNRFRRKGAAIGLNIIRVPDPYFMDNGNPNQPPYPPTTAGQAVIVASYRQTNDYFSRSATKWTDTVSPMPGTLIFGVFEDFDAQLFYRSQKLMIPYGGGPFAIRTSYDSLVNGLRSFMAFLKASGVEITIRVSQADPINDKYVQLAAAAIPLNPANVLIIDETELKPDQFVEIDIFFSFANINSFRDLNSVEAAAYCTVMFDNTIRYGSYAVSGGGGGISVAGLIITQMTQPRFFINCFFSQENIVGNSFPDVEEGASREELFGKSHFVVYPIKNKAITFKTQIKSKYLYDDSAPADWDGVIQENEDQVKVAMRYIVAEIPQWVETYVTDRNSPYFYGYNDKPLSQCLIFPSSSLGVGGFDIQKHYEITSIMDRCVLCTLSEWTPFPLNYRFQNLVNNNVNVFMYKGILALPTQMNSFNMWAIEPLFTSALAQRCLLFSNHEFRHYQWPIVYFNSPHHRQVWVNYDSDNIREFILVTSVVLNSAKISNSLIIHVG